MPRQAEALPLDTPLLGMIPLYLIRCAVCQERIGYATRFSVRFFRATCREGCSL